MKTCKSCQSEISEKAKKCPKCQTDQRNWFVRHKILTGIVVLVLLGIVIGAAGGDTDSENKNNTTTPSGNAVEEKKKAQKISADDLADDFDANQPAAEKKWKDKYVQFTSEVTNITEDSIAFSNVGSKEFSTTQINCEVENEDELLPLKNGKKATVRGTIGDQFIGVITVTECTVVK